ncbi:helix-turn-helix transcriptional regulator [Psychromonas antarctica]|jgi:DNA-binding NarL/FixJ family response regulator|uniref:helix-turn-helix transcriptional regulator n=1 Tax=Psychromonas antarctica TaxID=67573 RepID=UPI001EE7BFD9|nr:LuxR C-terminal-related transcriptional regulator [Psychromonas antarctica]MCG6202605.1 LuxR C-terminal-related transcriptional regulator [Psychromonas antarctica]
MNQVKFSLLVYSLIFLVSFIDIIMDWASMGGLNSHILVEVLSGLIALIAFAVLVVWNLKQNKQMTVLRSRLTSTKKQLNTSQLQTQKLMGEFSKIIQTQFDEWQLTKSEKEVALLLLKGLTLHEIAGVRETRGKTVRQQASNLYKKAGITGRHELVAYFFEDLLIT